MQSSSCDSGNLLKSHSMWRTQLAIALAHHDKLDAKKIYQKDACRVGHPLAGGPPLPSKKAKSISYFLETAVKLDFA